MKSFAEFEPAFLDALAQERADLQGLHGGSEAQVSAWIEHLFRQYLGYTHWKEITREGSAQVGSKGSKQLHPDLRVNIVDNGLIFVECKKLGRFDGPKEQEELSDAGNQLRSYIRAHVDQASTKPKTVLGVVTDGNRWLLLGLNRANQFHTIAEWAFLTDDPHLLAQKMWLLAKPALAQPTSAVVEFLARRTLAEVLKDSTKSLTKKVNEKLPDGSVSEELIGRWLRDVLSDRVAPARLVPAESHQAQPQPPTVSSLPAPRPTGPQPESGGDSAELSSRTTKLNDLLRDGLLLPQDLLVVEGANGKRQTATLTADGKVVVAGKVFDSVSPAAIRALELAGKTVKSINGWAAFRVLRGGTEVGSLLEIRAKYEDEGEEGATGSVLQESAPPTPEGPVPTVLAAAEQLKPILALLPELTVNPSKSSVSLYAGNLLVGYAYPRKRGLPRLRVYVGESCPAWATPDPTYVPWCFVDDWAAKEEKVVALFKDAARRRADDMAAGLDAYRRRSDIADSPSPPTPG